MIAALGITGLAGVVAYLWQRVQFVEMRSRAYAAEKAARALGEDLRAAEERYANATERHERQLSTLRASIKEIEHDLTTCVAGDTGGGALARLRRLWSVPEAIATGGRVLSLTSARDGGAGGAGR